MFNSLLALGQEPTASRQTKESLMPLPDRLRDGATVVLEAIPDKRIVLRKGTTSEAGKPGANASHESCGRY